MSFFLVIIALCSYMLTFYVLIIVKLLSLRHDITFLCQSAVKT